MKQRGIFLVVLVLMAYGTSAQEWVIAPENGAKLSFIVSFSRGNLRLAWELINNRDSNTSETAT